MNNAIWNLDNVSIGKRLTGLTLRIPTGVTAILGASGAGKTSLLNLLVGFEKCDSGRVEFLPPPSGDRLPLFWAPSNAGLWPHLSVRSHLSLVARKSGSGSRVDTLLSTFDLSHRVDARPADLSLGERARLGVARALAADPAVLVMDEPLSHVGQAQALSGWQAIRDHVARSGASLVFATHSPETVIAEASHVVCLCDGTLAYQGDVATLYNAPPSPQAAECLGFANWFEPAEAATWLGFRAERPVCLRPEHLSAAVDDSSQMEVQSTRSRGAMQSVSIRHRPTGVTRSFVCRCNGHALGAGDLVRLVDLRKGGKQE